MVDTEIESMDRSEYDAYADEDDMGVIAAIKEREDIDNKPGCVKKKRNKVPSYLLQKYLRRLLIVFMYAVSLVFLGIAAFSYIRAVVTLDYTYIQSQIAFYPIILLLPFCAWVVGTLDKSFEYQNRKILLLLACTLNACLFLMYTVSLFGLKILAPLILAIPLSPEVTDEMLLLFVRILMVFPAMVLAILTFHSFFLLIMSRDMRADVMSFKLERYIDFRPNKKYKYDMAIVRKKTNGAVFYVKEAMRAYHMMILGATGSGKTSMAFNTAIANDMDKHILNLNKLKKEVVRLVEKGRIILKKDIEDSDFSKDCFVGKDDAATEKLNELFERYQRCGITIIAPNSSFADDVYELAKNRGFSKINRIDPDLDSSGNYKPDFVGLNPLFVPNDLPVEKQYLIIVNKARVFSDVLQALFEAGGKTDVYFSGLNRQFTSSICVILMKAAPLLHKKLPAKYKKPYVTPMDFYNVINDFPRMKDYCDALDEYLATHRAEDANYRNKLTLVKRDILGPGAKTMSEQARGLVVQAGELLDNPHIRNILCCENTVDFDEALANSEITLVNYSLALGDSDSRALGLFVLLLFQGAVFRRPKKLRPIHFVYIDEFPVLLHRNMEKCFSIFRQYNVAMGVALQSLSQFEKEPSTAFMKNVMLVNASTQIIFGRAGVEEMEIYQKLGGKKNAVTIQDTVSQSSLSDSDPSYSYSERSSLQQADVFTGRELRNKDFSEATMLTVDKGNPVDMFSVVLDFITPKQKTGLKMDKVDWHKFYKKQVSKGIRADSFNASLESDVMVNVDKDDVGVSRVKADDISVVGKVSDKNNFSLFDLQAGVDISHKHTEQITGTERATENMNEQDTSSKNSNDNDILFGSLSSPSSTSADSESVDDSLFENLDLKIGNILGKE